MTRSNRQQLNLNALDKILENIIVTMNHSKDEIFEIAEVAREEVEHIEAQLADVQSEVVSVIQEADEIDRQYRLARLRLVEVSRDFNQYNEGDIRRAYNSAQDLQVKLAVLRESERRIRQRRDDLMRMLKNLKNAVNKADALANRVNTVVDFLQGGLSDLSHQIEDLQERQSWGLRVLKSQEEERQRMARDIHDGPAQTFANLLLRIDICEKLLDSDVAAVRQELKELKATARTSLTAMRKIIYNLRPMSLDDLGLIPALRRLVDDYNAQSSTNFYFSFIGQEWRLLEVLELTVFRIVQECLSNVFKHAQATRVRMTLEYTKEFVQIEVRDNGIGFHINAQKGGQQFGLRSMQERAELLEGEFSVQSTINKGTKVAVQIPMKSREVAKDDTSASSR